jgi:xanthine/CO dehydrogenase XdhC/CoxF family maturation factor
MLVAEDGRSWGGVSGGCLERDVARRARGVVDTGRPVRCCYDTADDEAITPGTATGCGGAVELFIQRLDRERPGPIPYFARVMRDRRPTTLCTLVGFSGGSPGGSAGECVAVGDGFGISVERSTAPWCARTALAVASVPEDVPESHLLPTVAGDVFVERLMPPQALVVFGAGPDAVPVVAFAKVLGWHVTVVGSRPATGLVERFAAAGVVPDALHLTGSDDPVAGVAIPSDAAVVVMTHNVGRDGAILAGLRGPFRYLGLLGPRHRTRRLLAELPGRSVRGVEGDRFFSPVGLDLGARAPEEIALAIVAEIQACLRGASARRLRERRGHVHRPIGDGDTAKVGPDESAAAITGNTPAARCPCPA